MAVIIWQGAQYEAHESETVLEALLRQGAKVPFSCRKGSCHTCILKCDAGSVEHSRPVDADIVREHHILPCVAYARSDLTLDLPDPSRLSIPAELVSRRELGGGVFEIAIAPMRDIDFLPGQYVQLIREDGVARPYSLASQPGADFFFTVHVQLFKRGEMSGWLCREAAIGEKLSVLPPRGDCVYTDGMRRRPLLLLATGSGGGAMAALAQQALNAGHTGAIRLYHGARNRAGLYLDAEMRALAARHANFAYTPCLSGEETAPGAYPGYVTQAAFTKHADLSDAEVFLCGNPAMVDAGRYLAVLAGALPARIHADPFDAAGHAPPRDALKVKVLQPDPELWAALENGALLTRVLESFYARVYADDRLAPYFQGIPKSRVVQKQYEFLAMMWSRQTGYLGLSPFNSHHWMVISDDMFDHREALFQQAMEEQGVPAWAMRRIKALHELFRTEIVKPAARGMVIDGVEQPLHTHKVEALDIDAVCDNCGNGIPAGTPSRYHYRIGALHCAACAAL